MGYGNYDYQAHQAATNTRAALPQEQVFRQSTVHPMMNPYGVKKRESRDSQAHPDSVSIIFALDVSGSMGSIPAQLAKETLPSFMKSVMTVLPDPQVMFLAFGNATADRSPLQVGQFESENSLMDKWLEYIHLEGGGGGLGESYDMAMYFAARHTSMDCIEKRGRRGYFFMTGDEPAFPQVSTTLVKQVIGDDLAGDIPIQEMARELEKSFQPFFLIPDKNRARQHNCERGWRDILGDSVIVLETPEDTAVASAILIGLNEGQLKDLDAVAKKLKDELGRQGEPLNRVIRAVEPFAAAIARGGERPEPQNDFDRYR